MHVELQMKRVFSQYFDEEIKNIEIKEENYESFNDYRKYAFIKTLNEKEYIIKAYRNTYNRPEQVEGYGDLSQRFYDAGINVARFYKNKNNKYLTQHDFSDGSYILWCEEKLPYDVFVNKDEIGDDFFSHMGSLLGRMHITSKNCNISYPWFSAVVMFNSFSEEDEHDDNYENAKSFYDNLMAYKINKDLLKDIWNRYNKKRKDLEALYTKLPFGAVQGDLSICNVLKDKKYKPIAVIDFNQSGNDKYVSDMMQWLIYFVFDGSFKKINTTSKKNFIDFYKAYSKHYKLNEDELSSLNILYNIIRPFRYYQRENVIIDLVNEGRVDDANKHLEKILYEISREDIIDLLIK